MLPPLLALPALPALPGVPGGPALAIAALEALPPPTPDSQLQLSAKRCEALEKRVAELERELAAATAARARLAAKLGEADDESSEGSRPRLISFDTERPS